MNFTLDSKLNALKDCYVKWLGQFNSQCLRNWQRLYKDDPEAAMCEAAFWQVLQCHGVQVEPNEDLTGSKPSPDFRCYKRGEKFYVEVTCMEIDRVTRGTSLPALPDNEGGHYADLNKAIFYEVINKTEQCANLDGSALVAVGTFHGQASELCVEDWEIGQSLTGKEMISRWINTRSGQPVGEPFLSTEFKFAAFLREWLQPARRSISGVLIGGFGCRPPKILGLLHPDPIRPFNRALLSGIKFGRLCEDRAKGTLDVEWF